MTAHLMRCLVCGTRFDPDGPEFTHRVRWDRVALVVLPRDQPAGAVSSSGPYCDPCRHVVALQIQERLATYRYQLAHDHVDTLGLPDEEELV